VSSLRPGCWPLERMRSLNARLEALEQHFNQTSAARQLELLYRGVGGDQQALDEFERICATGKALGLLADMYHALGSGPVEWQSKREKQTS